MERTSPFYKPIIAMAYIHEIGADPYRPEGIVNSSVIPLAQQADTIVSTLIAKIDAETATVEDADNASKLIDYLAMRTFIEYYAILNAQTKRIALPSTQHEQDMFNTRLDTMLKANHHIIMDCITEVYDARQTILTANTHGVKRTLSYQWPKMGCFIHPPSKLA